MSEDCITFTNIEDHDEMQQYAAFHLDLHCLQKNSLRGFSNTTRLINVPLIDTKFCTIKYIAEHGEDNTTPDRRQSKTLILSTNVDQKLVRNRVADCHLSPIGDRLQS